MLLFSLRDYGFVRLRRCATPQLLLELMRLSHLLELLLMALLLHVAGGDPDLILYLDWLKGKSTGNHGFPDEIRGSCKFSFPIQ